MDRLSDDLLIEKLKSTVYTDNDEAMSFLYKVMYRKVAYFIQKNKGTEQDADDIFQDALIALYKLSKADRLQSVNNVQAYFFSICKNLWYKTLKKNQKITGLTEEHHLLPEVEVPMQVILSKEKNQLLNQLLGNLGEQCKQILIHYYYERLKMKEIKKLMNFSSEQVTKNKKFACMKKLKEIINANPGLEALLK